MRTLTSGAQAALASGNFAEALLVEMDFDPPVYFTTMAVDLGWNDVTWLRTGSLGAVDAVKDSSEPGDELKFSISGVPSENISLALGQSVRNVECRVYFAILDGETNEVLDAPMVWAGLLDQLAINDDVEKSASTIGATAKHIGALFSRVKVIKYTAADQQKVSAGDTSLRFITSQSVHKDIWPAASWGRA